MVDTIANMTPQELKRFVEETVDERLTRMLGTFEIAEEPENDLTWDEIRALADRHRWTPPSSAKSALEFLREDRER